MTYTIALPYTHNAHNVIYAYAHNMYSEPYTTNTISNNSITQIQNRYLNSVNSIPVSLPIRLNIMLYCLSQLKLCLYTVQHQSGVQQSVTNTALCNTISVPVVILTYLEWIIWEPRSSLRTCLSMLVLSWVTLSV